MWLYLFWVDRLRKQADDNDGNGTNSKENQAKVQIVHFTDDIWYGALLIGTTRWSLRVNSKLQNEAYHTSHQSNHQTPEGTL